MPHVEHYAGRRSRRAALLSLALLVIAPLGAGAQQLRGYMDHSALGRELRSLTRGSDIADLQVLGRSLEGREIWMVRLGDPGGALELDDRPALIVVANLEGSQLAGSHLAVEAVRHVVSNPRDPDVRQMLDERVVYVVPRLNVDGAEAAFGRVLTVRRGNARPFDDDNDGRVDEDAPRDLNDDGMVTLMRVEEAGGEYMIDPEEDRLLIEADPSEGQTGVYTLYREGMDADGDGFIAEDGPGGVDLDRNFQHAYPYYAHDAGLHMVSEPETRALMDFMVAHGNIGAVLAFGSSDNLVTPPDSRGELMDEVALQLPVFADRSLDEVFERGDFDDVDGFAYFGGPDLRGAQVGRDNDPQSGRRPATTVDEADLPYYGHVSERYRELTGIEEVALHREPEGAFFQYGYFQFGVPSFMTPGWGLTDATPAEDGPIGEPADDPAPAEERRDGGRESTDARLLSRLEGMGVEAFVPWREFQHPELGPVEIGGFVPYAAENPPIAVLEALGPAHGAFMVELAGMLPRVEIVDAAAESHGGGLYTVTAQIRNTGFFPTSTRHGVVSRTVDPTTVQIQVDQESILTGMEKTVTVSQLAGSGRREDFQWVIRGESGQRVEITLRAEKGGRDTATVTLR